MKKMVSFVFVLGLLASPVVMRADAAEVTANSGIVSTVCTKVKDCVTGSATFVKEAVANGVGHVKNAGLTCWEKAANTHPGYVAVAVAASTLLLYKKNQAFQARVNSLLGLKQEKKRSTIKRTPATFRKIADHGTTHTGVRVLN